MKTWYCVLILVAISNGEKIEILFQDDMNTDDNFEKSPSVQFVSDELCAFNICAKMPVSSPPTYLQTKIGEISTIGYSNIVLKFDLALTGFGLASSFKITTKFDASSPYINPYIAIYDNNDHLIQDKIYHNLTLNLSTNIENNDKLGIFFMADDGSNSNDITPYVFIDNIVILGSVIPTINPTHSPTSPPCGGIQHCSMYFDGCNNCECYMSSMTCSKRYCSILSDPYCISCIDGYFINKNGECQETEYEFGVKFSIQFRYDVLVNNGSIITETELNNVLMNITDNLLDANTESVVDQNCINRKDYDIDIDEIEKNIIINATIFVCNEETETILTVHVHQTLETDLLDITANNPILFVPKQNISIDVSVINRNDDGFESTVIISTKYDDNVNLSEFHQSDNILFLIIVGILGSIIFICIVVMMIIFIYKAKKDKHLYKYKVDRIQTDSVVVPTYKIGEPATNKQKKHKYQLTPTEDEHNNNENNPFDDIDTDNINPTQIVYDEIINDEIFVWLRNTVKLEQYYQSFKQNGYDSLQFVKEITMKKQLIDIGINNKEHLKILINKINDLKNRKIMKNGEDHLIIIKMENNDNINTPN